MERPLASFFACERCTLPLFPLLCLFSFPLPSLSFLTTFLESGMLNSSKSRVGGSQCAETAFGRRRQLGDFTSSFSFSFLLPSSSSSLPYLSQGCSHPQNPGWVGLSAPKQPSGVVGSWGTPIQILLLFLLLSLLCDLVT
ncbi:hypothetical protein IWX90DRAFT_425723 [Phyllosticta citrichinensis]|uniref:Transmembrane protein n=1 Tax=Phyllosticta citrichinensis TaxID=1130410 RepID=A0ABR1Y496_9PEZI